MAALSVAIGAYPNTARLRETAGPQFTFADVRPINQAFAPMVREERYDICEMALMTFLQARAYGRSLALLPVAVAARFQEGALLCRADDATIRGPFDLRGKRVGARAYSQTTGVWVRGVLADDYTVACQDVRWITFEDAHVPEYRDPPWVERATPGSDMLAMLRDGRLDAVIVGNDVPDDPGLRTVFPDPEAAATRFGSRHGFMPVNHLIVVRKVALSHPQAIAAFIQALLSGFHGRADLPVGCDALTPAVALALRYMAEQQLLPRPLTADEAWEGLPPALRSPVRQPLRQLVKEP